MELKTMQYALDNASVIYGYKNWEEAYAFSHGLFLEEIVKEAIKLYALQIAEAACKEQRTECADALHLEFEEVYHKRQILDAPQPDIDKLLK